MSGLTEAIIGPDIETTVHYLKILLFEMDALIKLDLGAISLGERLGISLPGAGSVDQTFGEPNSGLWLSLMHNANLSSSLFPRT